jgi:glycosyltransferase involved in cell wall biosynthesis
MLTSASIEMKPNRQFGEAEPRSTFRPEVTYLTSFLPYPIDQGGIMATAGFIEALAKCTSVSVLVLTSASYPSDQIRAAENYYNQFCRCFVIHQFDSLAPKKSAALKAWHYLCGYPRQGFWSKQAEDALISHIHATSCQVVWCNSPFESKYLPAARRVQCRTVVTTHNIESDLIRQQARTLSGTARWSARIRILDMQRLETKAANWADVVTAITDIDLQRYRRVKSSDRLFLLPFGYRNIDASKPAVAEPVNQNAVCFVGTMDWPPNVSAARFLAQEVMPLVWKATPDTKCFLVGKNPGEELRALESDRVIVTGSVPSIDHYYRTLPVVAVPMREGSGVKIKLIEALAAGCAVVSTSLGAAGLTIEDGRHLIVADSAGDFARAIVELLNDKSRRVKMGTQAQAFVRETLSSKRTEQQVEKILECLHEMSRRRNA